MPNIVDPWSGKSNLYKGRGRSKDRDLGRYDRSEKLKIDKSQFNEKQLERLWRKSDETVPTYQKWSGRPMSKHRMERLEKEKRKKNRQKNPKPKKITVPSMDSQGNLPQWSKGDRVTVAPAGRNATVIGQILSQQGYSTGWSKVKVLYDDNMEGLCLPDDLRSINGNTPQG